MDYGTTTAAIGLLLTSLASLPSPSAFSLSLHGYSFDPPPSFRVLTTNLATGRKHQCVFLTLNYTFTTCTCMCIKDLQW